MSSGANLGSVTQQWVVGMDASPDARRALEWALTRAAVAATNGTRVHLTAVTAWSIPVDTSIGLAGAGLRMDWNTDWDQVGQATAQRLEEIVASVTDSGDADDLVTVSPVTVQGSTVQVLLAQSVGADLLVVGRRGMSPLKELVLGSVSRHLVTHASVPTVVVPADTDPRAPLRRAVIGFDGSSNAVAAVDWACTAVPMMAESPTEVELDVICAEEISPLTDEATTRSRFPDEVARLEDEFAEQVDKVDPEGRLQWQFSLTGARRALADHGAHAGLVVLGARGRGAVGSALLGSVTTWMLHHATVPLVVVPDSPQ